MSPDSGVRRMWWCLTDRLTFIPIHAVGIYPSGPKLSDFVVSSYVPTIGTLIDKDRTKPLIPSQLLTVSLPKEAKLPGTEREIRRIASHSSVRIRNLYESDATPESVLDAIKQSEWAHFACHGKQDYKDPTKSCLLLTNGSELKLSDIINLKLGNAQLAFLSACQTASGDKVLPDEAIHLAAGMILAGYHGVIATMETVNDEYAADIADKTYQRLFKHYSADSTKAAEALQYAIQEVRKQREASGDFSFSWVPFIHMGI
jgi:CHAT domain-containing protein